MKVKVMEVDATKLDPNAKYIIVFNEYAFTHASMDAIVKRLEEQSVRAVYASAKDPETAMKIYQIPTEDK